MQLETLVNAFLNSWTLDNQNIKYNMLLIKMDIHGYECHVVTNDKNMIQYDNVIKK